MTTKKFKYFAILGSMRSGSNLLEQSLNQYSDINCYGEFFNPAFVGGPKKAETLGFSLKAREADPFALINTMIADNPKCIAGFRLFNGHDPRVVDKVLLDKDCAKIILRRNPLESYISLKIAQKTDQWLLHDAHQRKSGKVVFDADEYKAYRENLDVYYTHIRTNLQENGQAGFWLRYPEQKDVKILNGVSEFLGAESRLKSIKEKIRRQNPEPLQDKVENYTEMQAVLGSEVRTETTSGTQMRANIPRMITTIDNPILFAPIPGGPNEEILRWMNALDNGVAPDALYIDAVSDGKLLHTGHNQRTLFEWMDSNPTVATITASRHPIPRAYDAFMAKIFLSGANTYDMIRKQLVNNFDILLPDAAITANPDQHDLAEAGYSLKQHRAAFHGFLKFLNANLSGQTSIRIDGLWALQTTFISGFNTSVPISLILKEGALDSGFRFIGSKFDLKNPTLGPPIKPDHIFTLDEIYTRQTENLARKVYRNDYTKLGYDDYQAALEV